MKKIHTYICLLLVCFAQISGAVKPELTTQDYSEMSTDELGKALVTAVEKNNQDAVKKLIQAKANVNQKITYIEWDGDCGDYNITCPILEYASLRGYVDIVKELIQAQPNIDDINEALITAAKEARVDVVRELIQAGSKRLTFFNRSA